MSYSVDDVIKWFLSKEEMTPKKLQKILYYAYSWHLTFQNENVQDLRDRLFPDKFEAWVHGPVIREVYNKYRDKGSQAIPKFDGEAPNFDADTTDILNQVWGVYGGYNGNELESISHQESPWQNAREGYLPLDRCEVKISDKDIFECYVARLG
ncbi:Panacea domain-containing protein [Paenibacillus sp. QZ-Y1]|uniref:Panacea domain-containing protein n=1 Tax=Paenibacillus sp. QZ-Y1 TaxID=3414511 RepID=UPI003F792EAC